MKIFKINKHIEIVCEVKNTRNGFKHTAILMLNGNEQESTKINYLNRTWERYEYESVLKKIVSNSKVLSDGDKKICNDFIKKDNTDWSDFKAVTTIAKLGDIFCKDQKESNDWKARMLKAGFENKGLIMPDDWDTLDEDTKQKRLDGVLKIMLEKNEN